MKNTIDKKGQKQGIWQTYNKAKTLLIEENYKNGVLHGKHTEIYKKDWFKKQFYMNGQLFGENLRNDKLIIRKFHELIDGGEWKIDKEKYSHSKFWFVGEKCIFEIFEYGHHIWVGGRVVVGPQSKDLYVGYFNLWSIFESEFVMNFMEVSGFIQYQVEKHFKLKILDIIGGLCETDDFSEKQEYFSN